MLSLRGATLMAGPKPWLREVEVRVERGECLVVCGPNGAGKSTLLRAIAGEEGSLAQGSREVAERTTIFFYRQERGGMGRGGAHFGLSCVEGGGRRGAARVGGRRAEGRTRHAGWRLWHWAERER